MVRLVDLEAFVVRAKECDLCRKRPKSRVKPARLA
jgi:hypothetical protein